MKELFEIASGSIAGREHHPSDTGRHKNNNDALHYLLDEDFFIGVVCDGCGSSKHSEVGAKIGARLIVHAVAEQLRRHLRPGIQISGEAQALPIWERVRQDVLAELCVLTNRMGGSFSEVVTDYFLFTTVGVVVTAIGTSFFSLGDGLIVVNGEITELGPFPGNEPPYLAYGIVKTSLKDTRPDLLQFRVSHLLPTDELSSFLIGSDGVLDIVKANGRTFPGKTEPVGPLSQFWENDGYFCNPEKVIRRLTLMNRDSLKPVWDECRLVPTSGLLPDDTTFIVGRRKRQEEQAP